MNLKVYTDGGFSFINKVGSWAFVVLNMDMTMKIERAGVVDHTKQTSQVAEIMAIMQSLKFIKQSLCNSSDAAMSKIRIEVISDSQYCVNTMNEWMYGWANKDWQVDKQNLDLWKEMHDLKHEFKEVVLKWVKGHSGDLYNERVDELNQIALKTHLKENGL